MITWPDCSPPRDVAAGPHRLEHVAVADLGLLDARSRPSRIACTKPRLLITVATTVSFLQPARLAHREREDRQDLVAVDDPARVVDGEAAVGVAVEGDADVGAVLEHRRSQRVRGGWSRSRR